MIHILLKEGSGIKPVAVHVAAQRNLFNRLLGCLHHCLATGTHYDEAIAFPTPLDQPDSAAA
jgi:hypothetical protein